MVAPTASFLKFKSYFMGLSASLNICENLATGYLNPDGGGNSPFSGQMRIEV